MYHSALKGFKEYRGSKCKYFTGKQLTGMDPITTKANQ